MIEVIDKCFTAMGTLCSVTIYGGDFRETAEQIKDYIQMLDRKWSVFRPDSEISELNRSAGTEGVTISADTAEILRQSRRLGFLTGGAFDVTTGSLTDIWVHAEHEQQLPSCGDLRKAKGQVNFRELYVKDDHAFLGIHGMKVDLGGIAKGYAMDRVLEMLRSAGVTQAVVNLGGTVGVLGHPQMIGIQNPMEATGCSMGRLLLENRCAVTSGSYESFRTIGGKRYHHIIDPRTGRPSASGLCSVTLAGARATHLDALATAAFVLGPEKALPILLTRGIEAIFVTEKGDVRVTRGLQEQFSLISA